MGKHEINPAAPGQGVRARYVQAPRDVLRLLVVMLTVLLITAAHYVIPADHIGVHHLLRPFYYLPVVLAAFWFGLKGGLATATTSAAIFLPHLVMQWGGYHAGNVDKFLELVLFIVFGCITGFLADRLRAANLRVVAAYGSLRERSNQLLLAEEHLGRARRLAALGELSAELAHEIRNPLGSIRVSAEIFRDRLEAAHPLREFAEILCKETDRLDRVLGSCLDMARQRDLPNEPGDPAEAAREVVQVAMPEATRARVQLALEFPGELPRVRASQCSLRQVFLNLTLNAIQAMPTGGRLAIEGNLEEQRVRIRFADTGVGIAPQERARIFEPFLSGREDGTGLGLAISRRLVAGAGGSLEVESQPGKGAVFIVSLPAVEAST